MSSKYQRSKPEIAAGFLIALLLVLLILTPAHSQSLDQADSLMQEGYEFYTRCEFPEALKKFEESLKIYEKLNNKLGEAKALGNIGVISSSLGNHKKALDFLLKALKIYEELGDKPGIGAVLGNIGPIYSYLGDYTRALDYCLKALKIQEEIKDIQGVGADLTNIGLIYYSTGDYVKALDYYQRALKIHEEIGYKFGAGTDLTNIGMVYSSLGYYQKALNYHQKALDIFEETGNKSGVAYALYNLGLVYNSLGDYPKALDSCRKSLKIYEELGDKSGAASALNNLGLVYESLGDYPKALDSYNRALKIQEETGDKSGAAGALNNMGSVYSSLGDFQESLDYHQKALKIYEELGKKSGIASALNNIGVVYSYTGDYRKSLDYHQKALKIFEEMGDKSGTGKTLNNIGAVYRYLGDYQKSLDYHQKALKIYEELGDRIEVGTSLGNIGSVYRYLGDYQKALDYSQKALKIYEESGGETLMKSALNNVGLTYDYLGDYPKALDYYQKALNIQEKIGAKNDAARTLSNIGSAYFLYGDSKKALEYLQRALKIHEETGDKSSESIALNNIGLLYSSLGDYRKSLDYHRKALKIFEDIGEADGIFKSLLGMGIAYEGLKEDDRAIDCLSKSVKTLEEIRGKLKVEEQKTIFMQKKVILYEELIELLLKKGRNEDAWQYTERAKARTLLDMLGNQKIDFKAGASPELINKEEELSEKITAVTGQMEGEKDAGNLKKLYRHLKELKEEYEETLEKLKLTNPEYASLKTVEVSSLKEIQKALDKDTLLLEYFIGSKKSYLFIVNKDSIRVAELSENEEKIGERISEVLARVSRKAPLKDEITSLSNILIKPALEDMKEKSKLVIIPHSVLHYLPFAMLVDSNGEYLVRNFQIITQPSASVWILCLNKKKEKGERLAAYALGDIAISFGEKNKSQKVALVRGTPVMSPEILREGLPPLPGTKEEVEGIASLYPGGKIFVGKNATIGQVKENSGNAALLHFATHGILDPSHPLFSGLVFSDGILTTSDIFGLNLKAGMVVLSACNTAGGRISRGDEIVGLARAFMYAGTPTVVASLWSISDVSTAQLMKEFYSKLKQGKTKETALQEAQKDMMENPEYSHPYYWAPFIIIGDGGA